MPKKPETIIEKIDHNKECNNKDTYQKKQSKQQIIYMLTKTLTRGKNTMKVTITVIIIKIDGAVFTFFYKKYLYLVSTLGGGGCIRSGLVRSSLLDQLETNTLEWSRYLLSLKLQ